MCSGCRILALLAAALCAGAAELKVCADPDNLPFSNSRGQGFENEVARLIAGDLGRTVHFYWYSRRALKPLKAGTCDVVMGIPADSHAVQPTGPYYRSSYAFVTRRGHAIRSFDDPALETARIGVQLIGTDRSSSPPAIVLAERGLVRNIEWYRPSPVQLVPNPEEMIDAVARGAIDVAVAWGPSAGYFARRSGAPVEVTPIAVTRGSAVPMSYAISMGVRPGDQALLAELNRAIERRRTDIRSILTRFGVPLMALPR